MSQQKQIQKKKDSGISLISVNLNIKTTFEWREGGNTVFVTGSFCNWENLTMMEKKEGKFVTSIDLPQGVYQYKFIVDDKWKYSKFHPIVNDEKGHTNNQIETTIKIEDNNKKSTENQDTYKRKSPKDSFSLSLTKNNSYTSNIPSKIDGETIICPEEFKELHEINDFTKQNCFGNFEYLNESHFFA